MPLTYTDAYHGFAVSLDSDQAYLLAASLVDMD